MHINTVCAIVDWLKAFSATTRVNITFTPTEGKGDSEGVRCSAAGGAPDTVTVRVSATVLISCPYL